METRFVARCFLALICLSGPAVAANLTAQIPSQDSLRAWADTTGEPGVAPLGGAVDVYRAALDLLYIDGPNHPSVIVMHDTAEFLGDRPCRAPCSYVWHHKSKIDTSAVLAYTRVSPKRPRIRQFGYRIPIILISYNDRERIESEGRDYLAAHPAAMTDNGAAFRAAFTARYPGAWGLTSFSKVAFNKRHDQALLAVRHSCGGECGSTETLFLKRVGGRWKVIERIPGYADPTGPAGALRYRGPAVGPGESEVVYVASRRAIPPEAEDAPAVYRAVLDSLYSFQGASPSMIVLTDRYRNPSAPLGVHRTPIDSLLLKKSAFLEFARTRPDSSFRYRLPVKIVLGDSLSALERIGARAAQATGSAAVWFGFLKEFPGAWGMVGFSRVAFNREHSKAMVYSNHQCGNDCEHGDSWILEKIHGSWRILERLPRGSDNAWDPVLFPLRYVGLDAKPNAYRHRRGYATFTNAVTNTPLSHLQVSTSGTIDQPKLLSTDSGGRIDLGVLPFTGLVDMRVPCPDQSEPDSLFAGSFGVDPGSDTTFNTSLNFRDCLHTSDSHVVTGAEANIRSKEARFVFPFQPPSESWDSPAARDTAGATDYRWTVEWTLPEDQQIRPFGLWLTAHSDPNTSPPKSLAELVAHGSLEVLIGCNGCVMYSTARSPKDFPTLTAGVEGGRVILRARDRGTIRKIFGVPPSTVTFNTAVEHGPPGRRKSRDITRSETVIVNCRSSDSTAYSRRRCNAPTTEVASGRAASTAPRRVKVVALSYDGASLMPGLGVRITSEDLKKPPTMHSTDASGALTVLVTPRDSVRFDALCSAQDETTSGGLAFYLAPGRDTTLQLLVDPRRCAPKP